MCKIGISVILISFVGSHYDNEKKVVLSLMIKKEGKEMVINRKEIARGKVAEIKNGFSAFAETQEVISLVKKC